MITLRAFLEKHTVSGLRLKVRGIDKNSCTVLVTKARRENRVNNQIALVRFSSRQDGSAISLCFTNRFIKSSGLRDLR